MKISPAHLDFANTSTIKYFTVSHVGTENLTWSAAATQDQDWITSIAPAVGDLEAGSQTKVELTIDRSQLLDGEYQETISVMSNGGNRDVDIYVKVKIPPLPPKRVKVIMP